jgi:hypothetical protein
MAEAPRGYGANTWARRPANMSIETDREAYKSELHKLIKKLGVAHRAYMAADIGNDADEAEFARYEIIREIENHLNCYRDYLIPSLTWERSSDGRGNYAC